MTNIISLPNEIIEWIIRSFSLKDILNFFKSCKHFYQFIYLLDEANKEWNIDDIINKNPFLLPIATKLINIRSEKQISECKKLISVIFNYENTQRITNTVLGERIFICNFEDLVCDKSHK